jgi:hypothetical protein
MNPLKGGKAVIHRGRDFVLRPHAVIDRSDHRPGPAAEVVGDEIVRIETTNDVAAAMKMDNDRHRRCRLKRPVEPQADHPAGAGDETLLDLCDRKRLGLAGTCGRLHLVARLGGCHLLDRP